MADLDNLLGELADNDNNQIHPPSDDEEYPIDPSDDPTNTSTTYAKNNTTTTTADINYDNADENEYNDAEYKHLKKIWISELSSPELLPHDSQTVELYAELLRGQDDTIEELMRRAAAADGGGMGRQHGRSSSRRSAAVDPMLTSFAASIYRMEADRVRFILADLARERLRKIEDYAAYSRDILDRMTEEEVDHLKAYGELLEKHYRRTVLDHLPGSGYRRLDEPEMIVAPDLNQYVFCRCVKSVQIDNGDDDDDGAQEHAAGSCLIARYGAIRSLVFDGRIELLL